MACLGKEERLGHVGLLRLLLCLHDFGNIMEQQEGPFGNTVCVQHWGYMHPVISGVASSTHIHCAGNRKGFFIYYGLLKAMKDQLERGALNIHKKNFIHCPVDDKAHILNTGELQKKIGSVSQLQILIQQEDNIQCAFQYQIEKIFLTCVSLRQGLIQLILCLAVVFKPLNGILA